jgi:hypothetical protein
MMGDDDDAAYGWSWSDEDMRAATAYTEYDAAEDMY